MTYCTGCGKELEDSAKFCPYCGTKTQKQENYQNKRTEEYAGKVIKCPSCGAELPSFTAVCPSCGHEVNSSRVSESLNDFVHQIEECDRRIANSPELPKRGWATWSGGKKFGWVLFNIFFACIPLMIYLIKPLLRTDKAPALTREEKHKASIIENYTFPDDRGSIIEALMFVKTKVSFLSTEKASANNTYWARLWTKKAEQLYDKAELLFPNDQVVNSAYNDIEKNFLTVKKKLKIRLIVTAIAIVVVFTFLCIRSGSIDTTNYNVTYEWPKNEFTQIIPKPDIEYGKISSEYTKQFQFELYKVSAEQFNEYAKACREAGFDVDITKNDSVYYADNAEGYDLNIFYYEDKKEMHVSIDSYDKK